MNYTIASTEDVNSEQVLDLSKDGNGYIVSIYDRETHMTGSKKFETLKEAESVYVQCLSRIIHGLYDVQMRIELLKNA